MDKTAKNRVEEDWTRIDGLLTVALDLDSADRNRWLAELCIEQPAMAHRIGQLLGLINRSYLIDQVVQSALCEEALRELMDVDVGSRFGTWTVQRPLGIGGMSEVYLARRELEGGEQLAALKLLSPGMTQEDALARFIRETAILSQLNDARIARLIDTGRAADGRPWLAMEYVDGEPIDLGCNRRKLSIKDRVKLLIGVAKAVDYAHRHLVVHRDIKPGNVLLCGDGQDIRLLDFGIAKVLEPTDAGPAHAPTRAFTLNFASPEQLAGQPTSTASDIYQLGVLLYLLLTGIRPFRGAAVSPMENLLAMQEGAPRPSIAVQGNGGPDQLERCAMRPQKLAAALRGDLDTIVLGAMAFEPLRRYLSARELANDLQRWLNGEAILARPDRLYRIGRKMRKHWIAAAAVVLSVLLILSYAANTTWQRRELQQEKGRIARILDTMTDMFSESDPFLDDASPVTVNEVVTKTTQRFLSETDEDPEFQVLMMERLASLQDTLRDHSAKKNLLQRALVIADANALSDVVRARLARGIADAQYDAGDLDQAQQTLRTHARLLANADSFWSDLLQARILLERGELAGADRRFVGLLREMTRTEATPELQWSVYVSIGKLRRRQGNVDAALQAYERALTLTDPNPARQRNRQLTLGENIAVALTEARRYAEADRQYRRQIALASRQLGDQHPALPNIVRNYSALLFRTLRIRSAHELLERYETASATNSTLYRGKYLESRAWASFFSGNESEAFETAVAAAEKAVAIYGAGSPALRTFGEQIAWMLFEHGAYGDALAFAEAVEPRTGSGASSARLVLALAGGPGVDAKPLLDLVATINADRCYAVYYAALRAVLIDNRTATGLELPGDCDGYFAALVHALGVHWVPDWADGFIPESFSSPLLRRLKSEDPPSAWRPNAEIRKRMEAVLRDLRPGVRAASIGISESAASTRDRFGSITHG